MDKALHFFSGHDCIQEAMLQQKLRPLESVWQFLPNGLLDHARPGKADQRARLGNVRSPSIAKLAVTPPVVGSVNTEM